MNEERWADLPDHLKAIVMAATEAGHTYRNQWYWGGEASLRVSGTKMALTTIPDEEWETVEAAAVKFWDKIASESPTKKKVVDIFKQYNADMQKAGRPYRYG